MSTKRVRSGAGFVSDALVLLSGVLWLVHFAAQDAISLLPAALLLVGATCFIALLRVAGMSSFGPALSLTLVAISIVAFVVWNTDGSQAQVIAVIPPLVGVLVAVVGLYLLVLGGRTGGRS